MDKWQGQGPPPPPCPPPTQSKQRTHIFIKCREQLALTPRHPPPSFARQRFVALAKSIGPIHPRKGRPGIFPLSPFPSCKPSSKTLRDGVGAPSALPSCLLLLASSSSSSSSSFRRIPHHLLLDSRAPTPQQRPNYRAPPHPPPPPPSDRRFSGPNKRGPGRSSRLPNRGIRFPLLPMPSWEHSERIQRAQRKPPCPLPSASLPMGHWLDGMPWNWRDRNCGD
jgi:hypothetical protein